MSLRPFGSARGAMARLLNTLSAAVYGKNVNNINSNATTIDITTKENQL